MSSTPPEPLAQALAAGEADQEQLIKTIKTLVEKSDKAATKAEQFRIAAGQHLKTLKVQHTGTWAEWEELLKTKVKISTGRASELMQIADGRKTVEQVRAGKAESMKRVRASSPRGEENAKPGSNDEAREQPSRTMDTVMNEFFGDMWPAEPDQRMVAVDPVADEAEPDEDPEIEVVLTDEEVAQRWQETLGYLAGDAIAMEAGWLKSFGPKWKKYEVTSDTLTLVTQARDAWQSLLSDLRARNADPVASDPRQLDLLPLITAPIEAEAKPPINGSDPGEMPEFLRRAQPVTAEAAR